MAGKLADKPHSQGQGGEGMGKWGGGLCVGGLWVGVGWGGSKSFWGLSMVHPLLSIESLPAHPHHPTHPLPCAGYFTIMKGIRACPLPDGSVVKVTEGHWAVSVTRAAHCLKVGPAN